MAIQKVLQLTGAVFCRCWTLGGLSFIEVYMTVPPLSGFGHLCLVNAGSTEDSSRKTTQRMFWTARQKYTPLFLPDSSPVLAQHSEMKGN